MLKVKKKRKDVPVLETKKIQERAVESIVKKRKISVSEVNEGTSLKYNINQWCKTER